MTDRELDGLLRKVMMDAVKREWEAEQKECWSLPFSPSKQHEKQMRKMLDDPVKWAKNRSRPMWKTVFQKVAVILLIASVGFGGIMAASETVRAAVARWAIHWYETYFTYRYSGEDLLSDMPRYTISSLPEGMYETERDIHPSSVYVTYSSDSGEAAVYLDYIYLQQGAAALFTFDQEPGVQEVTVNGMPGSMLISSNPEKISSITWVDARAEIQFVVWSFDSNIDILHIAESVCLAE